MSFNIGPIAANKRLQAVHRPLYREQRYPLQGVPNGKSLLMKSDIILGQSMT